MKGNHVIVLDKLNATRTQKKVTDGLVYHRTKHHSFICLSCNLFQLTDMKECDAHQIWREILDKTQVSMGIFYTTGKECPWEANLNEPDPRNGTMSHSQPWGNKHCTVSSHGHSQIVSMHHIPTTELKTPYQILELIKSPQSVQGSLKAWRQTQESFK